MTVKQARKIVSICDQLGAEARGLQHERFEATYTHNLLRKYHENVRTLEAGMFVEGGNAAIDRRMYVMLKDSLTHHNSWIKKHKKRIKQLQQELSKLTQTI